MSIRLNNQIREDILKNVVEATFIQRAKQIGRQEQDIARYLRDFSLHDWLNAYTALPPWLQETRGYFTVVTTGDSLGIGDKLRTYVHFTSEAGFSHYMHAGRRYSWQTPGSSLSMNNGGTHQTCPLDIVELDVDKGEHAIPLARFKAFYEKRKKLETDVKVFSQKLAGVLRNVTTTKKLVAEWPEIQPHIPHVHKPIGFAIPRDELNALMSSMQGGTNFDVPKPGEVINL